MTAAPVSFVAAPVAEVARETRIEAIADKLRHNQAVQTPEATFEQLWEHLRLQLDSVGIAGIANANGDGVSSR